ncbi:MAG: thiamine pyrophosphate-dependent dehydrogenase E1 component subunit alpha [Anaerolineales bacterium]|nr:thiamine pyrophosphate-dependent dehydrogenase E1 component subunit alpha [Anaerolineales bacterium]
MIPEKPLLQQMFTRMVAIRRFEEAAIALMQADKLVGEVHAYLGQEASAVGVCSVLSRDDYITSTHRGHGHVIAKGASLRRMMAELMGRRTGLCKGKGGSMHIADVSLGILGANGIVAGGLPIAVGAGLAAQMLQNRRVVACFFGDGASNEGAFHESLNLAACWKLPVVFVCEDNKYHEFSLSAPLIAGSLVGRAAAYAVPGVQVDGQDVLAVYQAAQEAVGRARDGEGPSLLVVNTFRISGHFVGEEAFIPAYRSSQEVAAWQERDPIALFRGWLVTNDYFSVQELDKSQADVEAEIQAAVASAEADPLPEPEEALEDLFVTVEAG